MFLTMSWPHCCVSSACSALSGNNVVMCWGDNTLGQLNVPTVSGSELTGVKDIAAGDYFSW